jgi:hypothetical protein
LNDFHLQQRRCTNSKRQEQEELDINKYVIYEKRLIGMLLHAMKGKTNDEVRLQRTLETWLRAASGGFAETRTPRAAHAHDANGRHAHNNQQLQGHRQRVGPRSTAHPEIPNPRDGYCGNFSRVEGYFSGQIPTRQLRAPVATVHGELCHLPRLQATRYEDREGETVVFLGLQRLRCEIVH